ncbi:cadherin-7 isoform X2 [Syngnathoides biaculeatus]|uniref:cadherin-7 isoform X2 n=1 Tax=Syngnathoides biaculeatus TaxID=300417 RepID=UPI002ADE2BB6|nr:cadherin-7 isoform X2 [Syngnathoides biaculeatus]
MAAAEYAKARSLLAALTLLALLSHSDGIAEGQETARLAPDPRAAGQHRRLKRGWIWKQLFVPEEDPILRVIGQLKSDSDRGELGIQYILSGEGAGDAFEIDEYSGEIRTLKKLDREEKAFYVLQAQAINRRSREPEEPQSEFIIKVQDINDNAPQFPDEPYVASVPEMCPTGTTVAQVTATDADDPTFGNNAKLLYSILQGEPYFSVEPKTGIVVTSWPDLDREAKEQYLVVVQVKDMLGLSGGHSASATVTVSLDDINDNGPIFQHHLYTFAVPEDAAPGTTVGRVKAEDADTGVNARMNYSLRVDPEEDATFTVRTDPLTQEGVILLAKPLDYESKRRYVVVAEAVNEEVDPRFLPREEFSDRTTVKIMVGDVDEPPVFLSPAYEWKVAENAAAGIAVGAVSARDTDAAADGVRQHGGRRGTQEHFHPQGPEPLPPARGGDGQRLARVVQHGHADHQRVRLPARRTLPLRGGGGPGPVHGGQPSDLRRASGVPGLGRGLVGARAAAVATQAPAKGGERAGAARHRAAESAVLHRGGPGPRPARARPAAPAPQETREEAGAGGAAGQHPHVPARGARGRRLQAVHPGPAGGGGRGPRRAALRPPDDVRVRGLGILGRVAQFAGVVPPREAGRRSRISVGQAGAVARRRGRRHRLLTAQISGVTKKRPGLPTFQH